jgi:molecular chaperone DnaJ
LHVEVEENDEFEREGLDLYRTLTLDYPDLALGVSVDVPLLSGKSVKLKVPAGLQPGKHLKLKGKGLPSLEGRAVGDLFVIVEVRVPKAMTAAERELVVALRELQQGQAPQGAQDETRSGARAEAHSGGLRAWLIRALGGTP